MKQYKARGTGKRRKRKNGNVDSLMKSFNTFCWLLGGNKPKHIRKKKWF